MPEKSYEESVVRIAKEWITSLLKDKARLDFVEATASGYAWSFEKSLCGSGYLLYNDEEEGCTSARDVIDAAMKQ